MGSAKDPENTSRHRTELLDGLPVTDRRLDVAGISTPVLEGGAGAPIILLHGIGGFAEEWACVVPKLVSSHRVVVPDLPGLGRSRLGNATLDATSVVEWLRALIDMTCDEPPTLVGHSLGGGIAARFAIAHPHKIRCVVLEDSSSLGRFRPAPGLVLAIVRFGARPTRANHDRFLRRSCSILTRRLQNGVIDGPRQSATTSSSRATRPSARPPANWSGVSRPEGSRRISSLRSRCRSR